MQMPWRAEIIDGCSAPIWWASTSPAAHRTSSTSPRQLAGAETTRASVGVRSRFGEVWLGGRTIKVGAFPISIDSADLDGMGRNREIRRRAKQIRAELGSPRKLLLGVDRLDYTKGIDVRLKAFSELLAEGRIKGR